MKRATAAPGGVNHLDHFVLPVMDPERGEQFYREVLGGRVVQRMSDPAVTRIFMKIGENHIGLFSQSRAAIPRPRSLETFPRCAFVIAAESFAAASAAIERESPLFAKVADGGAACGREGGIVFSDSEGNLLELFPGAPGEPTYAHHLHFDTTSLEESVRFYAEILGLELARREQGWALLKAPSEQGIALHRVEELSEVTRTAYRGRHFAFHVTDENFRAIVEKLHRAGIEERDEHGEREGRRPGQLGTYFKDPSGLRIQITNEDSATFARHAEARTAAAAGR